ncbi:MAG TPA: hypothetical protein VMV92_32595 [Streptosporangiaceae bacterium]|nr:hypothetical protein [Streptosporangiaceae bacterium]
MTVSLPDVIPAIPGDDALYLVMELTHASELASSPMMRRNNRQPTFSVATVLS